MEGRTLRVRTDCRQEGCSASGRTNVRPEPSSSDLPVGLPDAMASHLPLGLPAGQPQAAIGPRRCLPRCASVLSRYYIHTRLALSSIP